MVFDTALVVSTLLLTTPILFAATGELVAELAGVINIGIEGMMLAGAFFAYWAYDTTGSPLVGLACGLLAGAALGGVMALFAVQAGADQVVVGIGIVVLAMGSTSLATSELFGQDASRSLLAVETPVGIPLLDRAPFIGRVLFDAKPLEYVAFALLALTAAVLYKTRAGLAVRAAGEMPEAVTANGLNVRAVRWAAVLFAGSAAGLGGAFLSIGEAGTFVENMTGGRGYLALAAVIFGGWRIRGVLFACLAFGFCDALQLRLQGLPAVPVEVWALAAVVCGGYAAWAWRHPSDGGQLAHSVAITSSALLAVLFVVFVIAQPAIDIPNQLLLALPYLVTLIALAGLASRVLAPRFLGLPYFPSRSST